MKIRELVICALCFVSYNFVGGCTSVEKKSQALNTSRFTTEQGALPTLEYDLFMNRLGFGNGGSGDKDKDINYYIRGLMQDLVSNMQYVNSTTPVAVTSFALLDALEGDHKEANVLGKQISESLMHEIHKFGIPVIDYKTLDFIEITANGDFILSRDTTKLRTDLPMRYVVAGTLTGYQGGYLINARVIGIESKAVVASAQSFIPAHISGALMGSDKKEDAGTVSIVQG